MEKAPKVFEAVFLLSAARRGQLDKVQDMIEMAGYPVDIEGDERFTALHLAVLKQHVAVVRYLVARGANIFSKNAAEQTPWQLAVANGDAELKDALMGRQLALGECAVCLEEARPLYRWPCAHQLCLTCATAWLQSKIKENSPFCCTAPQCRDQPPTWEDAAMLLRRDDVRRFDAQELQRFLYSRKDFMFCIACNAGGWIENEDCQIISCAHCNEV